MRIYLGGRIRPDTVVEWGIPFLITYIVIAHPDHRWGGKGDMLKLFSFAARTTQK